jgi:O-antigen ligase
MRSRDRITLAAGIGALIVGVFAAGGASRWVVIGVAVLAAAGALFQVGSRRMLARPSPLLVVIGVPLILTAIQLVPLPEPVIRSLQPRAQELVAEGAALRAWVADLPAHPDRAAPKPPIGATGEWRPISLDPPTTRIELVELCAYFLIAWMALRAAASERGRIRLLVAVAGVTAAVALSAIGHAVLGADKLFGIYAPAHASPSVLAPLLNENHLASLMALGALVAAGLGFHERRAPAVRAMWVGAAVLDVVVLLMTTSRGGVLGLAAGTTVGAVILVLQRLQSSSATKRKDTLRVAIPGAVIVLCTLVLAVYFGGGALKHQFETTDLAELDDPRSKYAAWGSALTLVEEAPILGVGRGAFEPAFTRVHPASAKATFSHLENEYLQAVVDWGIAGALAIAAAMVFAGSVVIRRWRNGPLAAGGIAAIAAIAVHSTVDFGLELPGVALPVVLVAATLLYVPLEEARRSSVRNALRLGAVVATLAVAGVAATPLARPIGEAHDAYRDETPELDEALAEFARHPVDYLAAVQVAIAAQNTRVSVAVFNHSLRLHPAHPGLHRAVAKWLAVSGRPTQAAIEYRTAIGGVDHPELIVRELVTLLPAADDAIAALPAPYVHWDLVVLALSQAKRDDLALRYLDKAVDAKAGSQPAPEMWRQMAQLSLTAGDAPRRERALTALFALDPTPVAALALGRIQLAHKNYNGAIATLTHAATHDVEARVLLCQVHVARAAWPDAKQCLQGALTAPNVTMDMRRLIHTELAKVFDALGDPNQAELERRLGLPGRLTPEQPAPTIDLTRPMR